MSHVVNIEADIILVSADFHVDNVCLLLFDISCLMACLMPLQVHLSYHAMDSKHVGREIKATSDEPRRIATTHSPRSVDYRVYNVCLQSCLYLIYCYVSSMTWTGPDRDWVLCQSVILGGRSPV